jgi:hypothetical protein
MRLKIKNAQVIAKPLFPKTYAFALSDLKKGTVQTNGGMSSNNSGLYRTLNDLITQTPCRISIETNLEGYTIDERTYEPLLRVSCNGAFIVGGFNHTLPRSCDNVLIPEGANQLGFSVEWCEGTGKSAPTISSGTGNENVLDEIYQTGDITLTISKP